MTSVHILFIFSVKMLSQPVRIKIEFLKKGMTQFEIARKMNVSRAAICMTIKGEIMSKKLRNAIARALGKRVEELWGDGKAE